MKKSIYILTIALVCSSKLMFGQVGIGTDTPDVSAQLDVVATNKGFLAPQIALTDPNFWAPLVAPATEGMLVYNTTDNAQLDPGYYFWDGATWQPTGVSERTNIVSDGVIPSILGYVPDGVAASAGNITVDTVPFIKRGCTQWTVASGGNGHSYCAYTSGPNGSNNNPSTGGVNWGTAYNVGKQLKGYLVTITSDAEWTFVQTVINGSNSGYGTLRNNIWIGNSKAINMSIAVNQQPAPGIPIEFYWITGEESKYNWSNTTTVQQNFATNDEIQDEPNNLGGNEGCTHIWASGMSSGMDGLKGDWNDAPCTETIFTPGGIAAERRAMNQLIIEFEQ